MKRHYNELLRAEIIQSVKGLSLIAKVLVDEFVAGHHYSHSVGPGPQFSQYRNYEIGDDLRLLDWKMLARSGKYFIKQSEINAHTSVKFIIDTSNSMLHTESDLSKLDFAKMITATLANLAEKQGDIISLYAINNTHITQLQTLGQKRDFQRFLQALVGINASGTWPSQLTMLKAMAQRKQKEILFFITDFYENNDELTQSILDLKYSGNEVIVLHIMSPAELEFRYPEAVLFEDLETGQRIKIDTKTAKLSYLEAFDLKMKTIKSKLLNQGISYKLFQTDQPIGEALQLFLKKRKFGR